MLVLHSSRMSFTGNQQSSVRKIRESPNGSRIQFSRVYFLSLTILGSFSQSPQSWMLAKKNDLQSLIGRPFCHKLVTNFPKVVEIAFPPLNKLAWIFFSAVSWVYDSHFWSRTCSAGRPAEHVRLKLVALRTFTWWYPRLHGLLIIYE